MFENKNIRFVWVFKKHSLVLTFFIYYIRSYFIVDSA